MPKAAMAAIRMFLFMVVLVWFVVLGYCEESD
jgi:hypothetical protein